MCNRYDKTLLHSFERYPLFVILDVYGVYFFGPGFSQTVDNYLAFYPQFDQGETHVQVLSEFYWPDSAGSATGIRFIAGLTDRDVVDIFGKYDVFTFSWGD